MREKKGLKNMEYLPILVKWMAVLIVIVSAVFLLGKAAGELIVPDRSYLKGTLLHRFVFKPNPPAAFKPLSPMQLWKRIIGLFLATRLLIIGASVSYAAATANGAGLGWILGQWWFEYDSYHYINIATNGYQSTGEDQNLIVFYPLYPFLIKLLHYVIPDYYVTIMDTYIVNADYYIAGLIVSNLFLLIGLYYLVRLVELEWKDSELASSSAKYLLIFPISFFFSIIYTESVFVTLCILSFYSMRKSRWLTAGLFAMLAALTRNQGVLLAIPIVVEMAVQQDWRTLLRQGRIRAWLRGLFPGILGVILPVVGIFIYLLINKLVSGDWFRFLFHQKDHWGQTFGFFAENLAEHMRRALTYNKPLFNVGVYLPQIILFFIAFGLLIYMTNKIRLSYALYSFSYLIISYSASALLSGARYVGGMFTLYLFLAYVVSRVNSNQRPYIDWILLFFLLFFTVVFGLNYVF
ncbi:MAG: putative integral rane protein [Paenibacillus sp.]|nr:putative integral rane protein [Paenibacillus sp.]